MCARWSTSRASDAGPSAAICGHPQHQHRPPCVGYGSPSQFSRDYRRTYVLTRSATTAHRRSADRPTQWQIHLVVATSCSRRNSTRGTPVQESLGCVLARQVGRLYRSFRSQNSDNRVTWHREQHATERCAAPRMQPRRWVGPSRTPTRQSHRSCRSACLQGIRACRPAAPPMRTPPDRPDRRARRQRCP